MIMNAVADHLWQSTWFGCAAWLLALLVRKDSARVRYWVWSAASLKFLVPFACLSWLGNQFILQLPDRPAFLPVIHQVAMPISGGTISIETFGGATKYGVIALWTLGSVLLLRRWIVEYLHSRALIRTSEPSDVVSWVSVRVSDRIAEPMLIGIADPVILLPKYALEKLAPEQVDAVIAHETWHVQRRDNLAGAIHTLVQALFWFHPFVWWIGAKLIHEREHACDEGALDDGCDPLTYAQALLRVCTHSVASRHFCRASAAGGDLRVRLRAIVSAKRRPRFALISRSILVAALLGCIAVQVGLGINLVAAADLKVASGAHSIRLSNPAQRPLTVLHEDFVYARNVSLRELISQVYSVNGRGVKSNDLALDYPRYDIELRASDTELTNHEQLVAELLKRQFNLELVIQTGLRAAKND
jgi:beta-lactamase regulating signal transducer with metallopeptidase domain